MSAVGDFAVAAITMVPGFLLLWRFGWVSWQPPVGKKLGASVGAGILATAICVVARIGPALTTGLVVDATVAIYCLVRAQESRPGGR